MDSPVYAELAGEASLSTYYTSVAGPAAIYPNAAQYIEDYTEKFGDAPTPFSAQAYDATGIVLKALEVAAEEADGEIPTSADVAAAARATENYEGLTGVITFDDVGDPEISSYYVIKVVSSDPDEWSNNELLSTLEIPSPLYAQQMAEMEEMEMTPEAES